MPRKYNAARHSSVSTHSLTMLMYQLAQQYREARYRHARNNHHRSLRAERAAIIATLTGHLQGMGLSVREQRRFIIETAFLLYDPRSEDGGYLRGAVNGIWDILFSENMYPFGGEPDNDL